MYLVIAGNVAGIWRYKVLLHVFVMKTVTAGPEKYYVGQVHFQSTCPGATELEMHLPNQCFHLPNTFSPDPKLLFIFKSDIFHLFTYKHVFAIKINK